LKATEIERKFLVRDDSWRHCADNGQVLQQAYLSHRNQSCVRVRLIDGHCGYLTIKFPMSRLAKEEYEYEIPVGEARDLLLAAGHILEKTRYRVLHDDRHWQVDVFAEPYEGLTLAEIEMASEDDRFTLPQWLGREVTGNNRYSNRAMAAASRVSAIAQGATGSDPTRLRWSNRHPD
jgi:CYTH domain-containing protein